MKRTFIILYSVICAMLVACSNNDLYEDMPSEIQSFISQYYPNSQLESFTASENSYTAIIKNGPTLVFNSDYKWIMLNGNGSILPPVLLFNDFPPALYEYLQETENTNNVFKVTRNKTTYTVELLKYTLTYDIATSQITGKEDPPA